MSQQALDMRSSVQAVRRHRKLFSALLGLGLLIGAGYAVLNPPTLSATALVVLPQSAVDSNPADPGATNSEMPTQVVIASSDSVLAGALPHVSPAMSLQALENKVQVSNTAGSILSITATGATAAEAEATANAVAKSYIDYVGSPQSPVGFVSATMLESATTATGSKLPEKIAIYALLGLLGGAVVGLIAALAITSNERRLRDRDAIANSIGAPVLASIPAGRPNDPASWMKLFTEYEPAVVDALALTRMLKHVGAGYGDSSLTILSLSSDPGALALGPQLAAFASAQGIRTALVVGPQQDPNVTATLRTACAAQMRPTEGWRKPLLLLADEDGHLQLPAGFAVVVTTVDGKAPLMPRTTPTTATVLGVSAGAATAEQLARAATAAVSDGRDIAGILLANPDPDDHTTGRVPRLVLSPQRHLPTRVNGVPTEIKP